MAKKSYKRKYARKPIRKNKKPRVTKTVKKYVRAAIHREIEDKIFTAFAANEPIPVAASGGTAPDQINLLPVLTQGVTASNRTGNQVKIRRSYLDMFFNLLPDNNNPNRQYPCMVKLWVVKYKPESVRSASGMADSYFNDFFRQGNSTSGFQGGMLDMVFKVNRDRWNVYATRTFKLGSGQNAGQASQGDSFYDNSSFNRRIRLNLSNMWRSALKYEDSVSAFPNNTNLWLVVQCVRADGTVVNDGTSIIEMHYNLEITYEDG